ncbi:hypothetical protein AVEN_158051-1 [Araneus ventricosus]|uniref:Uncharacterized protein n=1 Tax=Araneus ventricosus TaxID=182803 RepID=A0A4Y2RNZ8_ARAVE|nr:hypothetical protein AVEN_158051-1 [Araneus ventricosus]
MQRKENDLKNQQESLRTVQETLNERCEKIQMLEENKAQFNETLHCLSNLEKDLERIEEEKQKLEHKNQQITTVLHDAAKSKLKEYVISVMANFVHYLKNEFNLPDELMIPKLYEEFKTNVTFEWNPAKYIDVLNDDAFQQMDMETYIKRFMANFLNFLNEKFSDSYSDSYKSWLTRHCEIIHKTPLSITYENIAQQTNSAELKIKSLKNKLKIEKEKHSEKNKRLTKALHDAAKSKLKEYVMSVMANFVHYLKNKFSLTDELIIPKLYDEYKSKNKVNLEWEQQHYLDVLNDDIFATTAMVFYIKNVMTGFVSFLEDKFQGSYSDSYSLWLINNSKLIKTPLSITYEIAELKFKNLKNEHERHADENKQMTESIPLQLASTASIGYLPLQIQNNQPGGLFTHSNFDAQQQNNPETMDNRRVFQGWKRLQDFAISQYPQCAKENDWEKVFIEIINSQIESHERQKINIKRLIDILETSLGINNLTMDNFDKLITKEFKKIHNFPQEEWNQLCRILNSETPSDIVSIVKLLKTPQLPEEKSNLELSEKESNLQQSYIVEEMQDVADTLNSPQIEFKMPELETVDKKRSKSLNKLCSILDLPCDSKWMYAFTEVNACKNQEKKLKEIENEILNLQSQLQQKDEEINVLKGGSSQLIQGYVNQISNLEGQLQLRDGEMSGKSQGFVGQISNLESMLKLRDWNISNLERHLKLKDGQISDLEGQLQQKNKDIENHLLLEVGNNKEIQKLKSQILNLKVAKKLENKKDKKLMVKRLAKRTSKSSNTFENKSKNLTEKVGCNLENSTEEMESHFENPTEKMESHFENPTEKI